MIYLQNSDDLLPGPEIVVGTQTTPFSAGDICRRFGIRNIDNDTKDQFRFSGQLDCTVNEGAKFDDIIVGDTSGTPGNPAITRTIPRLCGAVISDQELKSSAFFNGELRKLTNDSYSNCIEYHPAGEIVEHKSQSYPAAPKYNIEGIYDALYKQYLRLQTQMSSRHKKIIFRKDIGWTGEVSSIIRDGNKPVDLGEYLYKGEYDSAICANVNFFDNKSAKASGTSTKKSTVYYSQIGALEPMQEWIDVYTKSTKLPGEKEIPNPFYDLGDTTKPNYDKQNILVAGPASIFTNFPLLSCDQVKVCEMYSSTELFNTLKGMSKYNGLSDDEIAQKAKELCPFTNRIPEGSTAACIANYSDNKIEDTLAKFLCQKGYTVDGVCQNACPVNPERPPIGKYGVCPFTTPHTCFQGPSGDYSHCDSDGLPLDLYTNFWGGITPQTRDYDVYAPETGVLTRIIDNTRDGQGMALVIKGQKSSVEYIIAHIQPGSHLAQGTSVIAGDKIGQVCTTCNYDYSNQHIHVRAEYNGQDLDPYYVYGDILGCNVKAPDPGMKDGDRVPDLKMCHTATGNALQDLASCSTSKPTPLDNNIVRDLYENGGSIEVPPVAIPGTANACTIIDVVSGKEYTKIDCLLQDISTYISTNYKDGVPAAMLKSTMFIETSLRNADTGEEYTGNPAETSSIASRDSQGNIIALGPMQFTLGTWNGLIQRHLDLMLGCIQHIGLNIAEITPDHRSMVGPAVCASAIKHIDDVTYSLGHTTPAADWGEPEVTSAARRYYGACEYNVNGITGNYCTRVWEYFQGYKLQFDNLDCSDHGNEGIGSIGGSGSGGSPGVDSAAVSQCKLAPPLQKEIINIGGYAVNATAVQTPTNNRRDLTCEAFGSQTINNPRAIVLHWTAGPPGVSLGGTISSMTTETEYTSEGDPYLHRSAQFLISTSGEIYQIAPTPNYGENHSTGLSYTSIGIENQGLSESTLTSAQISANVALVNALKTKYPSIEFLISHDQVDNFAYTSNWPDVKSIISTSRGIGCKGDVGYSFLDAVGRRVGLKYYRTPYNCTQP